jgi:hypothetical protein
MIAEDEEDDPRLGPEDRTLRCSICALDWPFREEYAECPSCGETTTPFSYMKPMDDDEARSLKRHYEFERFYEKWDAEQPAERLCP